MVMFIIGIIYLVIGIIYSVIVQIAFHGIERENRVEESIDEVLEDKSEEIRMVYGRDKIWTWNFMREITTIGAVIFWPIGVIYTIRLIRENNK